jgi:hypothetical protein
MAETENKTTEQKPFQRRGEDFESLYANNVYFVPTEWDLKMIFGEVDNDPDGSAFIAQHTSIAVPWLQVKMMHHFLSLQLGVYEINHGPIVLPPSIIPPIPDPPPEDATKQDVAIYNLIKNKREDILASFPTTA